MRRFDELILLISTYFSSNEIPYSIIGGVAIIFQGRFRTTEDIDFLIVHDRMNIDDFVNYCKEYNLTVNTYDLQEGFKDGSHIAIMDFSNSIRIDLKTATTRWDKGAISEAEGFEYENVILKITKPEYLIANKLFKGGKIDLEDAYSVYYQNEERLDRDLLETLINLLGVEKEFQLFLEKL